MFLRGDDGDFDYSHIDGSEEYDDRGVEEREVEESWFEEEEPEWAIDDDTPSALDPKPQGQTGVQDFWAEKRCRCLYFPSNKPRRQLPEAYHQPGPDTVIKRQQHQQWLAEQWLDAIRSPREVALQRAALLNLESGCQPWLR